MPAAAATSVAVRPEARRSDRTRAPMVERLAALAFWSLRKAGSQRGEDLLDRQGHEGTAAQADHEGARVRPEGGEEGGWRAGRAVAGRPGRPARSGSGPRPRGRRAAARRGPGRGPPARARRGRRGQAGGKGARRVGCGGLRCGGRGHRHRRMLSQMITRPSDDGCRRAHGVLHPRGEIGRSSAQTERGQLAPRRPDRERADQPPDGGARHRSLSSAHQPAASASTRFTAALAAAAPPAASSEGAGSTASSSRVPMIRLGQHVDELEPQREAHLAGPRRELLLEPDHLALEAEPRRGAQGQLGDRLEPPGPLQGPGQQRLPAGGPAAPPTGCGRSTGAGWAASGRPCAVRPARDRREAPRPAGPGRFRPAGRPRGAGRW